MSKHLTYRVCFCFMRRFKLGVSEAPGEIKALFDRYSENGIMNVDQLRRFLLEVQGQGQGDDKAAKEDAEALIMDSLLMKLDHISHRNREGLNLESFFQYLFSTGSNPPLPTSPKVHHDMNAPLSHYFAYTGHNSYLTGNQFSSNCSDVPIVESLQRGVRVIELDMWPNSTNDNVNVLHGGTFTTPVELIKCLRSIREYAFVTSDYPVVITLEDHLTPDLQAKVAEMITQTFGDMLFLLGSECLAEFPSPESLKRKIMISTKPPKEYDRRSVEDNTNDSKNLKDSSEERSRGKDAPDMKDKLEDYNNNKWEKSDDGDHKLQQNAAPEYKHLISIHAVKAKGVTKEWLSVDPDKVKRVSLSEQKLEKSVITHGTDIVRFTQRNIIRVYPKGTRLDSSNFNPLIGWMHGAQMVAFNMQGYGRSLWLMHGMFKANGGCGYVKKPDILLNAGPHNEVFHHLNNLPLKRTLKVKLFMGEGWHLDFRRTHFDLCSPPDFYAKVEIAGIPADSGMKKTKAIEDNWTPTWDEEFEFPLRAPELALLLIQVGEYDMPAKKDDFGGQTCIPVSELRTGIRAVPLYSKEGEKYQSVKLLVRFELIP